MGELLAQLPASPQMEIPIPSPPTIFSPILMSPPCACKRQRNGAGSLGIVGRDGVIEDGAPGGQSGDDSGPGNVDTADGNGDGGRGNSGHSDGRHGDGGRGDGGPGDGGRGDSGSGDRGSGSGGSGGGGSGALEVVIPSAGINIGAVDSDPTIKL